jgi:radical SAM protein with 4Fe4S-binding SPASM domain
MNDTVCVLPWMHLNIDPTGDVYPCCLTTFHGKNLGNLNDQHIEEIWNGDSMKSLRLKMLRGEKPEICSVCFDRESSSGQSVRLFNNKEFSDIKQKIPSLTDEDGTVKSMELKYWDFRFSNLCNFKCRSCVPNLSSSWIPDAKMLGWSDTDAKIFHVNKINGEGTKKFIDENIDHVEKIYFAGGEPLLMDEHWYIIKLLKEKKKFNVKLYYSTNLSTLEYKNQSVLDYWNLWNKGCIEVCPSLDEIGSRSELIRSGTRWEKLEKNLRSLLALNNISIKPSITVSVFNVFRITEILTYLIQLEIINKKTRFSNFHINVLQTPPYYHVSILDEKHKLDIIQNIDSFINLHKEENSIDLKPFFSYLITEISKSKNPADLKKFLEITKELDQLRNENTARIIPELNYLFNIC